MKKKYLTSQQEFTMIKVLKPSKEGITLRDPVTGRNLPSEGKAVSMTTFWRRRIADGSVIEVLKNKELGYVTTI
jgi:hypothetical protein